MTGIRIIPTLLLKNAGLVKGVNFNNHKYVGDPINAVKIFNEKEVDELIFLDISATPNKREPNYGLIKDISSEAFMPFAYGGGITSLNQIEKLFNLGVEKIIINTSSFNNPALISKACKLAGSQSIVISIDAKKNIWGQYEVYVNNGTIKTNISPETYALKMQDLGAGEIMICSINREGTNKGFDIELTAKVSNKVNVPVIASGGAGSMEDLKSAVINGNASAVAAGNMFVFHGKHKAVLITYPKYKEIQSLFN